MRAFCCAGVALFAVGCGPQAPIDETATEDGGSGTAETGSTPTTDDAPDPVETTGVPQPDPTDGTTGEDADETGEPPPAQTWCISRQDLFGLPHQQHALDLDGGGAELWTVEPAVDRVTKEALTRFTVQHVTTFLLSVADEFLRAGTFVAFGDVDGDGLADAILRTGEAEWVWHPGQPSGDFAPTALPFSLEEPELATLGDRNGDGRLDALRYAPDAPSLLDLHLGDGEGGFSVAASFDVEKDRYWSFGVHPLGDRRMLLVVEDACLGFCGITADASVVETAEDGSTLSVLASFGLQTEIGILARADRTGDGLPDLLLHHLDPDVSHHRVSWHDSPDYAETVALDRVDLHVAADFDLDGSTDVIEVGGPGRPAGVRFGIADEGLGPLQPIVDEVPPSSIFAQADFDGDGRLDLVGEADRPDDFALWRLEPCEDD